MREDFNTALVIGHRFVPEEQLIIARRFNAGEFVEALSPEGDG
jgi:hypothetical protein